MKTKKVLIIEDNTLNRSLLENLIGHKWSYKSVKNGLDGLKLLHEGDYDLVLLSIDLPIIDGITIFRKIKAENLCQCPIIAISSTLEKSEKDQFLEMGLADIVEKPIKSTLFLEQLSKHLDSDELSLTSSNQKHEDSKEILDKLIVNQLLRLNTPEGIKAIYFEFLNEFDELSKLIFEGLRSKDPEIIKESVHIIKGNSGTLGINQIYHLSAEAEKHVLENQLNLVEGILERLVKSREEVEIYLKEETIFKL